MATPNVAALEDILPGVGNLYLYQINRVRLLLAAFSFGGADGPSGSISSVREPRPDGYASKVLNEPP